MSGAIRIETMEWRVAQEGVTTFTTEPEARAFAARLAENMPHLGRVRIQRRRVIVIADHWVDEA